MVLATTGLLIGALLGLRFKVLILVPAFFVYSTAVLWLGVGHHESIGSIVLTTVIAATALELGYLCGTLLGPEQKSIHLQPTKTRSA